MMLPWQHTISTADAENEPECLLVFTFSVVIIIETIKYCKKAEDSYLSQRTYCLNYCTV